MTMMIAKKLIDVELEHEISVKKVPLYTAAQ